MSKVQSLSPAVIDSLRDGKISDSRTPGLSVEFVSGGTKVWRYKRRIARSTAIVKMTLGTYPAFTIKDARDWATPLNAAVERGDDPREAMKAEKARDTLTVEYVHGLYMAEGGTNGTKKDAILKPRTLKDKRYIFKAEISPAIGLRCIFDITDDDLWEIVETKGETAPVRANRLAAEMKVFFGWCDSRRGKLAGIVLDRNPAHNLVGRHFTEGKRKRKLSDIEIGYLLQSLAQEERLYRGAILLLLLTGYARIVVTLR